MPKQDTSQQWCHQTRPWVPCAVVTSHPCRCESPCTVPPHVRTDAHMVMLPLWRHASSNQVKWAEVVNRVHWQLPLAVVAYRAEPASCGLRGYFRSFGIAKRRRGPRPHWQCRILPRWRPGTISIVCICGHVTSSRFQVRTQPRL